jgi:hypothetical protein
MRFFAPFAAFILGAAALPASDVVHDASADRPLPIESAVTIADKREDLAKRDALFTVWTDYDKKGRAMTIQAPRMFSFHWLNRSLEY